MNESQSDSSAEILRSARSAHLGQLVQFDRLLKQTFVLGLQSHFTDDSSGVPSKLIYDSGLDRRGWETGVRLRAVQS